MCRSPLISVVVPTIGRPSLERAVLSALDQELPVGCIEVIVVNDSGSPLEVAKQPLSDPRVALVTTNRRRAGVARNTGAAVARGRYLVFLDDDDWLAPGALAALLQVMTEDPEHLVVYGAASFVDESGAVLGKLNLGVSGNCASHMLAGAWIPVDAALIQADAYFRAGGTDVNLGPSEETDMFRRLAMLGSFGNTSAVVVHVLRGSGWATTMQYERAVDYLRLSREAMLDQKHALGRLTRSAGGPYWHGRNAKAYMASAWWNVRAGRPIKAFSRLFAVLLSLLAARGALFDRGFAQALHDSQVPATANRIFDHVQC